MGEEPIRRILRNVGLTDKETDVYIFLSKNHRLKGAEIANKLRTDKAETYRILRSLQRKGVLELTLETPVRFETIQFDKVIDAFVKARRDEAALVENSKEDLIKDWEKISKTSNERKAEKFAVLEGEKKIYARIFQLIKETKKQLSIILTVSELLRAEQFGLFDALQGHPLKSKIQFNLLTEVTENNLGIAKILINRLSQAELNFRGGSPDMGLRLSPRMVIRDDEEILFFITEKKEKTKNEDESCLWTNCRALLQSFKCAFADLWENSTEIGEKILVIQTGKPVSDHTIFDSKSAIKKYNEILLSAKEEVIMITSSEGIGELSKNKVLLKELASKGVSVKVMAPIDSENLVVYKSLGQYCEIKHHPKNQLRTTLIDRQHLFQFKDSKSQTQHKEQAIRFYETAIYTNNYEQVHKTEKGFRKIWRNAQTPSAIMRPTSTNQLQSAVGSLWDQFGRSPFRKSLLHITEREVGVLAEKEIINKIIHAKRLPAKDPTKDINTRYGSKATAIIHSPSEFELPDMMISIHHDNKQSSFGAEDWLSISLWLETPKGYAFVPVAVITDNPKGLEWGKGVYRGTPAGENGILVKKSQLKITVQGNTLFAGWTSPVPLLPPKYVLPPASILFEGYGDLKTIILKSSVPSGRTQVMELNSFEAFITFFHPAITYRGPATDGMFDREYVLTAYPPSHTNI